MSAARAVTPDTPDYKPHTSPTGRSRYIGRSPGRRLPEPLVSQAVEQILEALFKRQAEPGSHYVEWLGQILESYALDSYPDVFDAQLLPFYRLVAHLERGEKVELARFLR